ncbi:alkaline phosphatase family protein [Streptomyces sp. b94]|uniref:alkaline phosphatase family protein n=1 Tax=Streptomyces sp. b94 TaxID=1827634 RepID=UPI000BEF23B5|nr:alkaline phosphatase family protein [Streptomyces sp. b94]
MSTATHPRSLVIGLDGVPSWLLQKLADEGVMPHMAALLPHGALRPLRAPVPEISSTSWASFLTGADPGRHGIYGFIDTEPGDYRTRFPNVNDLAATPVWQATAAAGLPALVLNVPGTYPAPPVHGALVSGFVAPDFDRAVSPPRLREALREAGYHLDVEVGDAANDPDGFIDRALDALRARRRAYLRLLAEEPWALALCVFTETDRIHHFLWRHVTDPAAPLHGRIMDFYREVDEAVAALVPFAGDGGALTLVSDHGFGPADTQFYLNAWLRQAGYLALPADAESLTDIDERTTAFALDPGRVHLNRRDRFPRGRDLAPGTAEEIGRALLALRLAEDGTVAEGGPGRPLVAEVLYGPELYSGPVADRAPDLVAMPAPGVQIRGAWSSDAPVLPGPFTGTHTRDDATFWSRGDTGCGGVDMRDVMPTVLAGLGIAAPPSMEGRDMRGVDTSAPVGAGTERSAG